MAIYHLSTKPIKRSSGRSATASSAYRSSSKLEDKRTGKVHDYTKKGGVVFSKCLLATDDNIQELNRSELWNLAEQSEKRKDARTAREIIVNIPYELSEDERQKLVDDFAVKLSKDFGVAVDYAIHLPDKHGDQRNHHAHIMMTTRNATYENNELKLHDKTQLELSNTKLQKLRLPKTQEQIKNLREDWANITNKALERNNINARIDHRSYAEQGKDQIPTVKLGWKASALERKGITTERGDINKSIQADNKRIAELKNEILFDKNKIVELKNNEQKAEKIKRVSKRTAFDLFDIKVNVEYRELGRIERDKMKVGSSALAKLCVNSKLYNTKITIADNSHLSNNETAQNVMQYMLTAQSLKTVKTLNDYGNLSVVDFLNKHRIKHNLDDLLQFDKEPVQQQQQHEHTQQLNRKNDNDFGFDM